MASAAVNYFRDLQLKLDATATDVRDAYKKLAKQWHPDKNKSEGAEEKFKEILAAYTHLQSDDRRETHARELKRQQEAASMPKPPPQPPPQTKPKSDPPKSSEKSTSQQPPYPSTSRPKSAKSKHSSTDSTSSNKPQGQKNWWDSFKAKDSSQGKNSSTNKHKFSTKQSRPSRTFFSTNSYMGFEDPFDDLIFNIFMIPPQRPPPKPKQKTDRFGNKLPNNLDSNLYDWKSATKTAGQMPDYQEYLDGETEFSCHWCGLMMDMEMLRKHEPRCQRLGGKRVNSGYQFNDEDVNEAYTTSCTSPSKSGRPKSSRRKIKCRWCGDSFSKNIIAEHLTECEHKATSHTQRRGQPRPEWNNSFTETEYDDPMESLFGARPRSAKIDVNDFNPFTNSPRSTCLQCKVKYGLAAANFCTH